MSQASDLDIRLPIGALFTVLGLLLTGYGILVPAASAAAFTKDGQVNLWWGLVMLAFGILMLVLGRRRHDRPPE
ncbi:MAG: hypothetical protein NVS4B3_00180 [Gemmatimonadaceae bacterium]